MSRRLRSVLPTTCRQLQPKVQDPTDACTDRKHRHEQQKKHFDKNAKALAPVATGERVRIREPDGRWKPATVVSKEESPRSFTLRTDEGRNYRRNRRHIRKTQEQTLLEADVPIEQPERERTT